MKIIFTKLRLLTSSFFSWAAIHTAPREIKSVVAAVPKMLLGLSGELQTEREGGIVLIPWHRTPAGQLLCDAQYEACLEAAARAREGRTFIEDEEYAARDARQRRILAWAHHVWGEELPDGTYLDPCTPEQRALRFFEEATEVAQVVGVPKETLFKAVAHVTAKEPDSDPASEIGDAIFTLAALAESVKVSLARQEVLTTAKNMRKDRAWFKERWAKKRAAGL